jgi:hypothetical protein
MSSDLSAYLGNKIVRWFAGNAMPGAPATLYVALFNGNPKTSGTEVTATIDATGRKAVTWSVPASGALHLLESSADVDFGLADADATVSHVAIYDASSSGNLLASKPAPGGPFSVLTGAAVKLLAGDLSFDIGSDT